MIYFNIICLAYRAQTPHFNLLPDTISICAGDSFLVQFPEASFGKSATYQWITDYAIIVHSKQLYIKRKGTYIVKINDGKQIFSDTTLLVLKDKPSVLVKDTTLCEGGALTLHPKNKTYRYTWNSTFTSETFTTHKPGKYWVEIKNNGCSSTDTFLVRSSIGTIPNFGKELLMCDNELNRTLSVKAPRDVKLYWNTGANTHTINIIKEGIYWVKSTSSTCGSETDSVTVKYKNCDCEIYIPNSFSPNDDDRNDEFFPVFQCEYTYFLITILDRWGNTVYVSNNINGKWDGKFKGNFCPDDVYIYRIDAIQKNTEKKITRNGHISLFR